MNIKLKVQNASFRMDILIRNVAVQRHRGRLKFPEFGYFGEIFIDPRYPSIDSGTIAAGVDGL